MEYFKSKTADDFSKLHDLSFSNTSKATKTTFFQSMRRIERIYKMPLIDIKLSFLNEADDFLTLLDASKYSENTKLTTLTNILKLIKLIDGNLIMYNKWLTILKTKSEKRAKNDEINLKNKLKVISDYDDIKKLVLSHTEAFLEKEHTLDEYRDFMILCLFTLQIPVRTTNYVNMKIIDDEVYANEDNNYLLINDYEYKFIFNKYRTSHLIGKKTIIILDDTLKFILDKWINTYNKNSNNFLIFSSKNRRHMNGKNIENSIANSSNNVFGFSLSIDNIRASYMKKIADLDPNFQDKLDIANILGYSNPSIIDKHTI